MIVWLASYPRSGNTFMRIALHSFLKCDTYSIYNDMKDIGANKQLSSVVGHHILKEGDLERMAAEDEYYFVKTHHLPEDLLANSKIIYLVRDGREASLSLSRFSSKFENDPLSFSDVVAGKHEFGAWHEHIDRWASVGSERPENFFTVKFEDLIGSPVEHVNKVFSFLGLEAKEGVIPNFKQLTSVSSKFFASGKTDSWRSSITRSEHCFFWSRSHKQMIKLGYLNDMPEVFENSSFVEVIELIDDMYNSSKESFETTHEIRKRVSVLELGISTVEKRAECLGIELAAERKRSEGLESELAAEKKRSEGLESELATVEKRAEGLDGDLAAAQKRAEVLDEDLAAAEKRAEGLDGDLAAAQKRAEGLDEDLATTQKRAKGLDDELAETRKTNDKVTRKLNEQQRVNEIIRYTLEEERSVPPLLRTLRQLLSLRPLTKTSVCPPKEEQGPLPSLKEEKNKPEVLPRGQVSIGDGDTIGPNQPHIMSGSNWEHLSSAIREEVEAVGVEFVPELESAVLAGNKPPVGQWTAIAHVPSRFPKWMINTEVYKPFTKNLFASTAWKRAGKRCKVIFTYSEDYAESLASQTEIKIIALKHPLPKIANKWSWEAFEANKNKQIIQSGWWLGRMHAIHLLPESDYSKLWIRNPGQGMDTVFAAERDHLKERMMFFDHMDKSVTVSDELPPREYEKHLCANIAFVHYYDVSSPDLLLHCIASHTPILINALPAVREYLGDDYPLYYYFYKDAVDKASDFTLVRKAHEYLNKLSQEMNVNPDAIAKQVRKALENK